MEELSVVRLYLLRGMYLLIAVGMGIQIWPLIVNHPAGVEHMRGVVRAFLGALTLLCMLGVRYPVKMLPLLFFEFAWKAIWVVSFGLPLWLTHQLTADTADTMTACLMGVVLVPIVLPWGYVFQKYVREPGNRWRGGRPLLGPITRKSSDNRFQVVAHELLSAAMLQQFRSRTIAPRS